MSVRVRESDIATTCFDDLEGDARVKAFEEGLKATKGDDLEKVITRSSSSIVNWAQRRNQYVGTLATKCITGYVIGVENRLLSNIMMCSESARVYNVYFKHCFNESNTQINILLYENRFICFFTCIKNHKKIKSKSILFFIFLNLLGISQKTP